jgi:hypothetical protein
LFRDSRTGETGLDLPKIFGIHLFLSGLLCFGFGAFHVTGLFGPGIWVSDAFGLTAIVTFVANLLHSVTYCAPKTPKPRFTQNRMCGKFKN